MGRPRKNEETTSPWVVRDVPAHIRRKVRVFAAEHDMTMAQAVGAMIEGHYGSEEDRQLLEALIKVYGRLIAEDVPGAHQEAARVTEILEHRALEGRKDSPQLPEPETKWGELHPNLSPAQIVEAYASALYNDANYDFAAQLLSEKHSLRVDRTLAQTVRALRKELKEQPRRNLSIEIRAPVFLGGVGSCSVTAKYKQIRWEGAEMEHIVSIEEKFLLAHEKEGWVIFSSRMGEEQIIE
jgi:hypothetical protein